MYVCGPTVYARAHVGNARPFVVGMWFRSWLRATGYDAQLVHNITDVNDKIYDAAPGASAELAARATEWYLEDTARPRARHARPPAEGDRVRAADRRTSSRSWSTPATRTPPAATSTSASRASPSTGGSPASGPTRSSRAGAERAQGGSARLRALEGEQAGDRGHVVGLAVGPRPAGLAHRVLGDGRGASSGRRSRSTAAGSTSSSRTTRTRSRSRGRSGIRSRRSGRTTGCSASPARRCRSRSGTSRRSARRSTSGGARRCSSSSSTRTGASRSTSRRRRWSRRRRGGRRFGTPSRWRRPRVRTSATGSASRPRSTTTSTRPRALAVLHEWASAGQLELLGRGLAIFGLGSLAERDEAPPEVVELAERRVAARAERGFRDVRPAARRARSARLGDARRAEGGYTLVRRGP